MYYLYILESLSSGKLYIGQTEDPDKRLNDHNRGASTFTKGKGPWKRIFLKAHDNREQALALEKKLKSWKNPQRIKKWIDNEAVG